MKKRVLAQDRKQIVDAHTYQVIYSTEDREYVATVEGEPFLSWLARTPEEALAGMRALMFQLSKQGRANTNTA